MIGAEGSANQCPPKCFEVGWNVAAAGWNSLEELNKCLLT